MRCRRASHAGSWYTNSRDALTSSLTSWLSAVPEPSPRRTDSKPPVHALIAPHAGYSYSGPAAAHAYSAVDPSKYSTVFVLGPSHHEYMPNQAGLTSASVLDTPIGQLAVHPSINAALLAENSAAEEDLFFTMDQRVDEAEHSVEMHLPYLRHVFGTDAEPGGRVQFVPIVVGALNKRTARALGSIFSRWLADGKSLFVVSTDFCHWGSRFGYSPVDRQGGEIWESIERLDREGMKAVESGSAESFVEYIERTQNTICGRFPIQVLLRAVETKGMDSFLVRFVHYEQSSKCKRRADSSVSYASAHVCGT
jgi:MEMO1 family protein